MQITFASICGLFDAAKDHIRQLDALVKGIQADHASLFYRYRVAYEWCIQTWQGGDFESSLRYGREALLLCEEKDFAYPPDDREQVRSIHQANTLAALAYASCYLGDYAEAQRCWQTGIALADKIGEQRGRSQHCGQLSRMLVRVGAYSEAEDRAQQALRGSYLVGDQVWVAMAHLALGKRRCAQRDYISGRRHLLHGVMAWKRTRYPRLLESLTELGRLELSEGHALKARACYDVADQEMVQHQLENSIYAVTVRLGLGWIALAEGNLTEADRMIQEVLSSGKCAAWEKMEGIAGLAEVAARKGRIEDAAELLALVVAHPFTAYAQRENSRGALEVLKEEIAPDMFATLVQAGEHRDLDATLAELVGAEVHP